MTIPIKLTVERIPGGMMLVLFHPGTWFGDAADGELDIMAFTVS